MSCDRSQLKVLNSPALMPRKQKKRRARAKKQENRKKPASQRKSHPYTACDESQRMVHHSEKNITIDTKIVQCKTRLIRISTDLRKLVGSAWKADDVEAMKKPMKKMLIT